MHHRVLKNNYLSSEICSSFDFFSILDFQVFFFFWFEKREIQSKKKKKKKMRKKLKLVCLFIQTLQFKQAGLSWFCPFLPDITRPSINVKNETLEFVFLEIFHDLNWLEIVYFYNFFNGMFILRINPIVLFSSTFSKKKKKKFYPGVNKLLFVAKHWNDGNLNWFIFSFIFRFLLFFVS